MISVDKFTVQGMVQHHIKCCCCEAVLDRDTAVVAEIGGEDGHWLPASVTCPGLCAKLARASIKFHFLDNDAPPTTKIRGISWATTDYQEPTQ